MNQKADDKGEEKIGHFDIEADRALTAEEVRAEFEKAIRAGKVPGLEDVDLDKLQVKFAPPPRDAYFTEDFIKQFFEDILEIEYAGTLYISEDSACEDFGLSREEVLHRVRDNYDVDLADMVSPLNLWAVLRKIEADEK